MGFKEKVKQQEQDHVKRSAELEQLYPRWQQASFHFNQTIQQYITADPDLRNRLSVAEIERRITDHHLKASKQLDSLRISFARPSQKPRFVSLEALSLSPPDVAHTVKITTNKGASDYYFAWDGINDSPNSWWIRSSSSDFDKRLNPESFNEILGELLI